jgi:hypothetical protein
VKTHREFNQAYLDEIVPDIESNHKHFMSKITCPVKIHLFLLPLEDKAKLSQTLLTKLQTWQSI